MNAAELETMNPYSRLDTTDETELPGARVVQRQELLDVHLADGSRVLLHRDELGSVVLRGEAQGRPFELMLPPEASIRLGSHAAALGVATLEPDLPESEGSNSYSTPGPAAPTTAGGRAPRARGAV